MQGKKYQDLINPFEELASRYDQWFDTPRGRAIFSLESHCLKSLMEGAGRAWLEVGVGTGRFAEALGVLRGVDPSSPMLEMAARRGILTCQGYGEDLPYPDGSFQGVLMATTLCFLSDPVKAFLECARVLGNNGCLVLGFVPLDSPWGQSYLDKGGQGHPFYSMARFYTRDQALDLASRAGFVFGGAASCLFSNPHEPLDDEKVRPGLIEGAGFAAMKFVIKFSSRPFSIHQFPPAR
jgi:ubiquinone/menaquinone biosynthesis C-methylase UbiE